jgi:hypothetical protein
MSGKVTRLTREKGFAGSDDGKHEPGEGERDQISHAQGHDPLKRPEG